MKRIQPKHHFTKRLRIESLEKRQLLAAGVIAPVGADLISAGNSYLDYGVSGSHWFNGSGLSDASIVETGDSVPAVWPDHVAGNSDQRVSRIRRAAVENTLTFDLGGTFDVSGMVLWNSTERAASGTLQTDRGFENTRLSYSTDGGNTFSGDDLLTWTQRSADASTNQGGNPSPPVAMFAPEVQMLNSTAPGVTHVRMVVDNFSAGGSDNIVMASELRFIGEPTPLVLPQVVIAPVDAQLQSEGNPASYLEYGINGDNWYNGSGLSDASIVETGDEVPSVWPKHITGVSSDRVSQIREAVEFNTLTFDLGGRFDLEGMALWNSTEADETDRGFEGTLLSYSTDGGNTFSGSDMLTWTQLANLTAPYEPEVQTLPSTVDGVTHVRMVVDNFSGEAIVMASELRFIGQVDTSIPLVADFSARTLEGEYNFTQGVEGSRDIEFTVTLSERNSSGSAITFDVSDLGTGSATSGLDYTAIATDAKIVVPHGLSTGSFVVNVIDDFMIEATETLNVQISGASDRLVVIDTSTVTGSINDNDAAGVTLVGANDLNVSETGDTDTYTIALDSIPTGVVQITATADSQLEISTDGIQFESTLDLSFTDMTPQAITVRGVNDQLVEDLHNGTVTHAITGTVVDPNYPDVTVESLYTVNGTDPTFQELITSGALPTGFNSTTGILGSTVDVNNAALEQGIPANVSIPQDIRIHTLANSAIGRSRFDRWTRWYQEDGKTQVYRIFESETNVRNDRPLAARIESFSPGWQKGVWNDFSARYTILKPESVSLFQSYQLGPAWSIHVSMTADGDIDFTHRRNHDGGERNFLLAEDMIGKSFEILVRDNGHDYEFYFNGELKGKGYYERPGDEIAFRWGPYRGERPITQDILVFANNVQMQADTSAPVGLTPYRLPTTSLSIESANGEIVDNDNANQWDFGDAPFSTLLSDDGARHAAIGPQLGATRDTESDGTESTTADGDGNDEDGVMFGGIDVGGTMAAVNIELPEDTEGRVDAWIDFDGNGEWDTTEKILNSVFINKSMQTINYDLPSGVTTRDTYARVRISSAGGLGPTGLADDGEVEDYLVSIVDPPQVHSIEINEGSTQRSSLDSVRITFDRVVDINQDDGVPFQITRLGSLGSLAPMVLIDNASGRTVVDLAFAPGGSFVTSFGSLGDGDYQLKIDASLVTYRGVELDGNGDGSASDDYQMSAADGLFRKYGDTDGTDWVGLSDFGTFQRVFGSSSDDPNDLSGLDADGDGTIGLTDFGAFRANFGA